MRCACFLIGFLFTSSACSQGLSDTTIHLKETKVQEVKVVEITEIYSDKRGIDLENDNKGITETLKKQESFFIKNYGQGALASISYRGTSAAQNEVYWNGVKINSPFTGQVDGNLLTIDPNTFVSLSSYDNNGIGAHINIGEQFSGEGIGGNFLIRYTTLNAVDLAGSLNYNGKNFYALSSVSTTHAKNDFRIPDMVKGDWKRQTHNTFSSTNVKATFGYKLNRRRGISVDDYHNISASFWWSNNNRELAPLLTQPQPSMQTQYDRSIRSLVNYLGRIKRFWFSVRTSALTESLHYRDEATHLNSRSQSLALRNEAVLGYRKKVDIEIAAKYDYEQANSDGFATLQRRHIAEIREMVSYYHFEKRFSVKAVAFQTVFRNQVFPTFNVAFHYSREQRRMFHVFDFSAARTMRIPSMNDLYWVVGGTGNPNLKPEKGWKAEAKWTVHHKYVETKLTAYGQYTTDYILWSPTTTLTIWSSENLKRVYGCGTEVFVSAGKLVPWHEKESDKWFAFITSSYSWNRAINIDATSANDASANKQLIYVPVHKVYAALRGGWKGFSASIDYTYFSKIYTLTDNSDWLDGYGLMDLHLSYEFRVKKQAITPSFGIYNLFDTQYQTMSNRAMPGRYYEVLLRFNLHG